MAPPPKIARKEEPDVGYGFDEVEPGLFCFFLKEGDDNFVNGLAKLASFVFKISGFFFPLISPRGC